MVHALSARFVAIQYLSLWIKFHVYNMQTHICFKFLVQSNIFVTIHRHKKETGPSGPSRNQNSFYPPKTSNNQFKLKAGYR